MSDAYVIWHNPGCSTSRFVLQALQQAAVPLKIRDYQKLPPSTDELREALTKLGIGARDLLRRKNKAYDELGLDDPSLSGDALISAMSTYPALIERPVVFAPDGARICRPKETIFEMLGTTGG